MSFGRAHVGVMLAVLLGCPLARADLFSPGPLTRAHASLEGLRNCTACHLPGQKLSAEKCLSCHTELAPRIEQGEGFHGHLSEAQRTSCQNCHHEHQGLQYNLIPWVPSKKLFPHQQTGWPLRGKHRALECEACHQPRRIQAPDVLAWISEHPHAGKTTFLGLGTECSSCHFDEHRGQLGEQCQSCHNEKAWRPATGFHHAETAYPLTGKHLTVPCVSCHALTADTTTSANTFPPPVSRSFAEYTNILHQGCQSCHADPHQGKFAGTCESCHTTAGWKSVQDVNPDRSFHQSTRYPLRGQHVNVPCKSCHGPWPGQPAKYKNLAFASCTDCHVDAHEKQLRPLTPGEKTPSCERCHTVEGFLPPHFEVQDHQHTVYPLLGAHQAVPCVQCHPHKQSVADRISPALLQFLKKRKRHDAFSLALFALPGNVSRCETCHRDPHAGQFKSTPCSHCHQVSAFTDLLFDHQRDSRFPLTGAHASVPCAACHPTSQNKGVSTARYVGRPTTCNSCHADVHGGQFTARDGTPANCQQCHGTTAFKPATFKHQPPFTAFALEGKHQQVPCAACHPEVKVPGAPAVRQYLGVPTTCAGCHADFHHGAFEGYQP